MFFQILLVANSYFQGVHLQMQSHRDLASLTFLELLSFLRVIDFNLSVSPFLPVNILDFLQSQLGLHDQFNTN